MVWSRWPRWLGYFPSWSRLHLRPRHFRNFQSLQQPDSGLQGSPTCHGRIQLVSWSQCGNDILCTQLLLPVRQPSGHHGTGWFIEILLLAVWPGSKKRRTSCNPAHARLFPLKAKEHRGTPMKVSPFFLQFIIFLARFIFLFSTGRGKKISSLSIEKKNNLHLPTKKNVLFMRLLFKWKAKKKINIHTFDIPFQAYPTLFPLQF